MVVVFHSGDPRAPSCPFVVSKVIERNRKMIGDEKYSDAVFLVGSSRETAVRIPVASFFLKYESEPFNVMFSKNWKEKEILIKDTDVSAMYSLIRWIYCHQLVFETGKLEAVLRLSHRYEIDSLFTFVKRHVVSTAHDSMWSIASFAHAFSQPDVDSGLIGLGELKLKCITAITSDPDTHITSEDFEYASCEVLTEVLQMDFNFPEIDLFKCCLDWAAAECKRKDLQLTTANKRKVMDPFIHLIGFPGMSAEEFARDPCESGVLTHEEQITILRIIVGVPLETPFSRIARKSPQPSESGSDDSGSISMSDLGF